MSHHDENEEEFDELADFRELDYEERIANYKACYENDKSVTKSQRERDLAAVLVPLLAMKCYHLPGNSWCRDLLQYIANDHPIFGICFHHRLHPLGSKTRIVALIGTLVFGLALTSFFELLYIRDPSLQHTLVAFGEGDDTWVLTSGMLLLWTVGGCIQTAYNLFMWHIAACSCMREGGCLESIKCCNCPSLGKSFLRIFVVFIAILSLFVVCFKVVVANDTTANVEAVADLDNYTSVQDFGFVVAYFVGMALSLFFWYFVGLIIIFSGVLGCFKLPVLGGRPRELAIEEKLNAKMKKRSRRDIEAVRTVGSDISKKSSRSEVSQGNTKQGSEPVTKPAIRNPPSPAATRKQNPMHYPSSPTEERKQKRPSKSNEKSKRQSKRETGKLNSGRLVFE